MKEKYVKLSDLVPYEKMEGDIPVSVIWEPYHA